MRIIGAGLVAAKQKLMRKERDRAAKRRG